MFNQTLVLLSSFIALLAITITIPTTTDAREIVRTPVKPGPPIEGRVIGGEETTAEKAAYQVSIQNTWGEHVCGGSIINKEWILTAAHCMEYPPEYLRVITGTANWTKPDATYGVKEVKVHCLHNKPMYHNDIALVRLDKKITYNKRTQPVKLATTNTLKAGDKLVLTGWGSTKLWGRTPDILQKVELQFINHAECEKSVRNSAWLGEDHLCTSTKAGQGSCHGDSGGPLVNENNEQVGIVNWGDPCAKGFPDAFASCSYFHDWIRSTMAGKNEC